MNAALLPVRSMDGAKKRLASALDRTGRRRLALAMLSDMIAALGCVSTLDRTVVVSADRTLLAEAARLGADTIDEGHARGLNEAVEMAARLLESQGVSRLLTIPGDVPLIEPDEVEELLSVDSRFHPVVLVPSASGTGTNALLTSPPSLIRPCFEGNSLEAYRSTCRAAGIEALVVPLSGFALDVDTIDDLARLARNGNGRRAARVAAEVRIGRPAGAGTVIAPEQGDRDGLGPAVARQAVGE